MKHSLPSLPNADILKIYFSNIGRDKSKLQKQISKLFILIAMAA